MRAQTELASLQVGVEVGVGRFEEVQLLFRVRFRIGIWQSVESFAMLPYHRFIFPFPPSGQLTRRQQSVANAEEVFSVQGVQSEPDPALLRVLAANSASRRLTTTFLIGLVVSMCWLWRF